MASVHNALRRLTAVQHAAKVAFGLDVGEGGLERLGETLTPIADLWAHPEWAHLRGERLCEGVADIGAGGAGNFSAASFSVGDDATIAVLEEAEVCSATAGQVIVRRGLQLPTNSAEKVFRDMRGTAGSPSGIVHYVNNVAAVPGGTTCRRLLLVAGEPLRIRLGWVLVSSGPVATETACVIYHSTANVALIVNFKWRERLLLPGEMTR